eukprot:GAHX01001276.1.p1 GENE.GAHX01001276.1~~GAHX01001276.1.p1  ORF type:complete len:370 (+),score=51.38 GAHX01001276.1:130-1239(+)
MYLEITIPILVIDILLVSYALYDIYKHYHHTILKPRLIMIALMIISDLPAAILTVITSLINVPILDNPSVCYVYMAFNYVWTVKVLALKSLTIFVALIVFMKLKTRKLNRIGYIMNSLTLSGFIIIQTVFLPLSGGEARSIHAVNGKTYNRYCGAKAPWVDDGFYSWQIWTSFGTLLVSLVLTSYSYFKGQIRKGTSYARLYMTFVCFSIVNSLAMFQYIVQNILKIDIDPKTTKYVLLDFEKLVPGFFSLIYILSETIARTKNINFDVKRILRNYKTRKMYFKYLGEMGAKRNYELLELWVRIENSKESKFDVLDKINLNKKEAQELIQKYLELDVYGFLYSEEFCDFYELYVKKGKLETDLVEELSE